MRFLFTSLPALLVTTLAGVALPGVPGNASQGLGAILTVSGILALLFPSIGGVRGMETGRLRP